MKRMGLTTKGPIIAVIALFPWVVAYQYGYIRGMQETVEAYADRQEKLERELRRMRLR